MRKAGESAERIAAGKRLSALDGILVAVKDNFCTKGIRTTCASSMLKNFHPTYNATVYQRLEDAGAILIGKTNMDQFGMGSGTVDSIFGSTTNIYSENFKDPRIVGGSSGGSSTAVAAGFCSIALGSDTGGSTRNPASYCGVVGFKPSYGLVSRHGLIPLVNSMDVPGILSSNVSDCAEVFNTIAGSDPMDATTIKKAFEKVKLLDKFEIKNLRVGIPKEYHCEGLSAETLEVWSAVADYLENNGAMVKEISMPYTSASIFVYTILNQCEVSSNMSRYDGIEYGHRADDESSMESLYGKSRAEGFNDVVKNRIFSGNFFILRKNYEKYFVKALKVRRLISDDFKKAFKEVDVLLTPTTLSDAPLLRDFAQKHNRDQSAVQDFCTCPANMAGVPAISIPIKLSQKKLPLSLQLMSPMFSEQMLFNVAKFIEDSVSYKPNE